MNTLLQVNMRLQIEIKRGEKQEKYFSRIEDIQDNNLIIAMPLSKGEIVSLHPGDEINVIAFAGSSLYQFLSRVQERRMGNIPLLLISKPTDDDIKKVQRRSFFRIQAAVPVQFRCLKDLGSISYDEFMEATTKDISGGGILLLLKKEIPKDTILEMKIRLNEKTIVPAVGRVVFVKEGKDKDKRREVAVEFMVIEDRDREKIVKFVFQTQLEQRKKELKWVDKLSI